MTRREEELYTNVRLIDLKPLSLIIGEIFRINETSHFDPQLDPFKEGFGALHGDTPVIDPFREDFASDLSDAMSGHKPTIFLPRNDENL